jgi:hypothetical protein
MFCGILGLSGMSLMLGRMSGCTRAVWLSGYQLVSNSKMFSVSGCICSQDACNAWTFLTVYCTYIMIDRMSGHFSVISGCFHFQVV